MTYEDIRNGPVAKCLHFSSKREKYVEYLSQTTTYANDRVSKPQYIVAIVEYE